MPELHSFSETALRSPMRGNHQRFPPLITKRSNPRRRAKDVNFTKIINLSNSRRGRQRTRRSKPLRSRRNGRKNNRSEAAKWTIPKLAEPMPHQRSFSPEPVILGTYQRSFSPEPLNRGMNSPNGVSSMSESSFSLDSQADKTVDDFSWRVPAFILNPQAETFKPRPASRARFTKKKSKSPFMIHPQGRGQATIEADARAERDREIEALKNEILATQWLSSWAPQSALY